MSIKLKELADQLRRIPTAEIDEAVALAGADWSSDLRSLQVMLSSPLRLKEERAAIRDALSPYAQLDTQLFEKMPDSGHRNVRESMDLAKDCDIVVALFEPSYLGSTIPIDERPSEYPMCAYYSELEMEIVAQRNRQKRLPRVYIYVKSEPDQIPVLTGWHVKYAGQFAPRYFSSVQQLIQFVILDVIGITIELRSSRLRFLSKQCLETKTRLQVADATSLARAQEVANLQAQFQAERVALTAHFDNERRTLASEHDIMIQRIHDTAEVSRRDLIDNHDRVKASLTEEAARVKDELKQRQWRAISYVSTGTAIGAIPLLILSAILLGWYVVGGTNRAITQTGELMASTVARAPVHLSAIPIDPMLVATKIAFARMLTNGAFTCDGPSRQHWPVAVPSPGPIHIDRDSVCLSSRELVLEGASGSYDNCEHKPLLEHTWWTQVIAMARANGLEIHAARLIGHSSIPRIRRDCGFMSVGLLQKIPDDVRASLDMADLRVRTNLQLAYVRARSLEEEIKKADESIRTTSETLGILRSERILGQQRQVTIALRLARGTAGAGVTLSEAR